MLGRIIDLHPQLKLLTDIWGGASDDIRNLVLSHHPNSLVRNIQRVQQESNFFMTNPRSLNDPAFDQLEHLRDRIGQSLRFYDSGYSEGARVIVFSNERNIFRLLDASVIAIDGTFQVIYTLFTYLLF